MKKKLLGVVLSLTLAVSGVLFAGYPMPAQAAKSNDIVLASTCNHVFLHRQGESAEYYEESNSSYHFVYVNAYYACAYCGDIAVYKEQKGYEEHDMRGVAPSPYRMSCMKCGYKE